jgi:Protein of unknown function (DUF1572)
METLGSNYLENAKKLFKSYKAMADKTFDQLTDKELHYEPVPGINSIAIILQHLIGNMHSRFTDFLTTDGEKPNRNRDAEFQEQSLSKEELLRQWENGWEVLFNTLDTLAPIDLLKTIYIRDEAHTALDAINRQVAHYSYHIGQIVYLGKILKGDAWQTLSIPKGKSEEFNKKIMKK